LSRRRPGLTGPYLEHRTRLRVRFQDVDVLEVVWHGHYLSYFEAGREALGEELGLGYREFRAAGIIAPVVHLSVDYLQPARYGDELVVVTRLHPSRRATLELSYQLRRAADDALLAVGRSTQAFTDSAGDLLLNTPELVAAFHEQWRDQLVEPETQG